MTDSLSTTNSEMSSSIQPYFDKIQLLFQQYEQDPYMQQRFKYHIMNVLPSTLENEAKNREKRITRTHFLTNEQQIFIQVFLSKHPYYYLHNNSCFYQYNGKNYSVIKEDDIIQQLLSTISKDRTLMEWRHKTKINIIKQIKERSLLKSIPETDTIQHILKMLYTTIFSNKNQVKYFLTILGDNILKKNNDLVFLTKPKTRKIIMEIENIVYMMIGMPNITYNIVTKFHENYTYSNCRLLKINDTISIDLWKELLRKFGLDLICVAVHYSTRYGSSEQFIHNNINDELKSYSLYLKNNSQTKIIDNFCVNSIELVNNVESYNGPVSSKISISWKNMHYIWKQYISSSSLPNMIYASNLKTLLIDRFSYDETTDTFNNVTSKYLPCISDFILFWEKNIVSSLSTQSVDVSNVAITVEPLLHSVYDMSDFDNEFEIDEICNLFKKWSYDNSELCSSNKSISEHDVLKIINHFFPTIEVIENKYIFNIKCIMWNKITDIYESLQLFREKCMSDNINNDTHTLIPFDDIYNYYFNFCTKNKSISKFVVSKRYFEKYLYHVLPEFIEFDKFVSSSWYLSKEPTI